MTYHVTFIACDGELRISSHPLKDTTLSQYLNENGWDMSYDSDSHKLLIKRDDIRITIQSWYFSGIEIEVNRNRCRTLGFSSLKSVKIGFTSECLTIRGKSETSTYGCIISVNGHLI